MRRRLNCRWISLMISTWMLSGAIQYTPSVFAGEAPAFALEESALSVEGRTMAVYTSPKRSSPGRGIFLYSHGMTSRASNHVTLLGALYKAGYDVVTYDLPGHGNSERYWGLRGGVKDFAYYQTLLAAVDRMGRAHFASGAPVVMAGWSLGGLIATVYLQNHGDEFRASVLYSPGVSMAFSQGDFSMLWSGGVRQANLLHNEELAKSREADPTFFAFPPPCLMSAVISGQGQVSALAYHTNTLLLTAGEEHFTNNTKIVDFYTTAQAQHGFYLDYVHFPESRHDLENDVNTDEVIGETLAFLAGQGL